MPASGDKDDFDSALVRPAQRIEIGFCDMKLRIQQCAVNINGKKADGRRHKKF